MNENDTKYMTRALELAQKGRGRVLQNPMVGAVLVRDGQVIGEGFHAYWGGNHAEVEALSGVDARGTTLYVNLEPCCHHGKTPPCTEALTQSGLRRVVVATLDPNPLVAGKGIEALKAAGVDVSLGILQNDARELNRGFFSQMILKRPWVTVKLATSLDGKLAAFDGSSKWISNEGARTEVRDLRGLHDAVLIGSKTFLADSPRLQSTWGAGYPRRFVLDPSGRAARHAEAGAAGFSFIIGDEVEAPKANEVLRLKTAGGEGGRPKFEPSSILKILGEQGINSVLIEGGGITAAHFLKAGLYDRLIHYIAPIIMGQNGSDAFAFVQGTSIFDALRPKSAKMRLVGDNVCVELEPGEGLCLQD